LEEKLSEAVQLRNDSMLNQSFSSSRQSRELFQKIEVLQADNASLSADLEKAREDMTASNIKISSLKNELSEVKKVWPH
jgi:hypothetical protein